MTTALSAHIVDGPESPWLLKGYEALASYFGPRLEMETLDVIAQRLRWQPTEFHKGHAFCYRLVALADDQDQVVSAIDYTVILAADARNSPLSPVVAHLSHIWTQPAWQGRHLVPQLLEHPLNTARDMLSRNHYDWQTPIVLAAEVEPWAPGSPLERLLRLKGFKRAGFKPVDPKAAPYLQPDFRPPEVIDASGPQALPFILLLRRLQREQESMLPRDEVLHIVRSLYEMYSHGIRPSDMREVYDSLKNYPAERQLVSLSWDCVNLGGRLARSRKTGEA